MQKCKSVLSLSQTREQLGLNDNEIVVYVRIGYLHPLIKFGIDSEKNIICEDFFTAKHERMAYFEYGIRNFNDEICFDCREIQALRDFRLDLDKVGNHCPDMKPDPEYVPTWARASADDYDPWGQRPRKIEAAQAPMALKPPMPPVPAHAPTPLPSPIGGQSEAQDNDRVAKLEQENRRLRDENERLQDENQGLRLQLAEKCEAQAQGVDAEQAEALDRLQLLEEAIGMPEDWSHATERKYPPIVRFVGYRLQGMDRDSIAAVLAGEKVKGTRDRQPVDVDCFTQSQISALLSEDPIEELSQGQIGVLIDKGGPKAAESYEANAKRAISRGLQKSVPPNS